MKIRVYYEDTDALGIIYHANYLKFCDRARTEYLLESGASADIGSEYGFIVKDLQANYLAPARLGDVLDVKSEIIRINPASLEILQEIHREKQGIFRMKITLVFMKNNKISKIPSDLRECFIKIS